jgi:hypothetical protein
MFYLFNEVTSNLSDNLIHVIVVEGSCLNITAVINSWQPEAHILRAGRVLTVWLKCSHLTSLMQQCMYAVYANDTTHAACQQVVT